VTVFAIGSAFGWALVVAAAARVRGRFFATFAGVIVGVHTLSAIALAPSFAWCAPVYACLHATVYLHFLSLVWARPRPLPFRALVSVPASFMAAGTLLAVPWAIVAAAGFSPWLPWLPYAVAAIGVLQSLVAREEEIDVVVGEHVAGAVPRRHRPGGGRDERPLRIVQITDPHLGPLMSERRLRKICERAVARQPDLILLTGDFLTMETHHEVDMLARALAPLRALEGRVFACRGNHDLEAPDTVARGLAAAGVRLLVDEAAQVQTAVGPVEILGIDFRFRGRTAHVGGVCDANPPTPGLLRIVLLHDPGAFALLPEGHGDLVLAGHTHGGQVGLVSLGLAFTMLRVFASMPDHGLWARGTDRLYVHRGTGVYGFPLRIGVPSEESLLRVHRARVGGPAARPAAG